MNYRIKFAFGSVFDYGIIPGTADKGKYVSPPKSSAVIISLSNTEN